MMIFTYDPSQYDFRSPVETAIGDIDRLTWDGGAELVASDQQTPWHADLYSAYDHGWLNMWNRFCVEWVRPIFGTKLAVQARPTWRVHPALNRAIGPHHTDRLYGHGPGTLNLWIPLTDTNPSNTLWVGNRPVIARYGDVVVFDGVNDTHGNVPNLSDRSRVSFDARLVPISQLSGGESFNTRTPLEVGGYYNDLDALSAS